jgi:hypothetical protein
VWAASEFQLGESRLEVFDDFGGDDVGIGKVRAVFKAFVFEPELNSLGAKNQTGRAERPTRWEARSQDGEVGFIVLKGSTNCEK